MAQGHMQTAQCTAGTAYLSRGKNVTVPVSRRLDYWKQKAAAAEADFYLHIQEQDQLDEQVTALVDLIQASRKIQDLEQQEKHSWIFK